MAKKLPKKTEAKLQITQAYQTFFSTKDGQIVLYDLLKTGHFMHTSYTGDVNDMIFREGERNIVNYILTKMNIDVGELRKFLHEQEQQELSYAE